MSADVAALLAHAQATGVDRLDAQLLLAHRLGRTRSWLIAHGDATVGAEMAAGFFADCARRADDWPLAYLVGRREFHGLDLLVNPAVLVPRPETETLVDWALELLEDDDAAAGSVVELGTGSGAIALALAAARPDLRPTATDVDGDALSLARENARQLGLAVEFVRGSWWQAVKARRYRLALANPPYVAEADPHLHALRHEPRHALCAGADGLAALDEIVAGAPQHLAEGGWLLLEHGFDQAAQVAARLAQAGFADIQTRADLAGRPRCTGGRRQKSNPW